MDGFKIASAFVEVDPSTEGFEERLRAAVEEAVAGVSAEVPIGANTDELSTKLDAARQKVQDFNDEDAEATLRLNADDVDAKSDEAKAKVDEFDGKEATATLRLDDDDVTAKDDDAKAKLDEFAGKEASAKLGLDDSEFDAKMDAAEARLEAFKAESADASLGASGGGAGGAGGGAGEAAGAGEGGGGGGLMALAGGGLASMLPGVGGAATGLGLLGGTGYLALGGVAKAVSAAHQASQSIGMSQQQLAATEFQDSVQIQQAQSALGQAHQQAAEDAIQSADQISQAQMSLAETERNASQQMVAAQQAVGQAEHNLADAQYTEQQAQVSLTEARMQAAQQLQQLQDAVKDAALNEQSASLAVQQAQYQQTLTDQNAYSTSLDRQQAALAVAQAQQQLVEAQQNQANTAEEASAKNKKYYDGQEQITQAQQALKDATYGVKQAQQQVADANTALKDTELNNADAIKSAQMAVTEAEQEAAFTQERDAEAVSQAQQNVTDTIKEQRLQLAAMKASANEAAQQYVKDMAEMTPAGRAVVRTILSMRTEYHNLQAAAQNSVMPGIEIFLRGVKSLLPTVTTGVREMGHAISEAFGQFGKEMQTKSFRDTLQGLMRNGIQFVQIVLPAIGQFIQALARIGGQQGAASGLANLLAGLMRGLTGLANSLGQYEPALNRFLTTVGKILTAAGPALGNMIGTLATVLQPLLTFLDSSAGKPFIDLLGGIVSGFLMWKMAQAAVFGPFSKLMELPEKFAGKWEKVQDLYEKFLGPGGKLAGMAEKVGPMFSRVAGAVGDAMSTAGGAVAKFVAGMGKQLAEAAIATGEWIGEHAAATAEFIAQNTAQIISATAAFIAENAAMLGIGLAIAALIAGILLLATHWHEVWTDIKNWAEDAWHFIWDGFGKYLLPLLGPAGLIALGVDELSQHWSQVWGWIKNAAATVWDGIKTGASDFVSGIETIWDKLESVFEKPVNFLINTVYDKGIAKLWNDVVSHIGLGSIKLPIIPALAGGGIVPGVDHGRDEQLVAMRPQEGVLVPGAVDAIGGPGAIHALNRAHGGGGRNKPGHFAQGGTSGKPGGIGGLLSDVGHDIASGITGVVDIGKMIAAVSTGNTTAFVNAAGKFISTPAAGDLAKVMIGVPKTMVTDAAKQLVSMVSTTTPGKLPTGSTGAVGSLPANWKTIAQFLSTRGFSKYAAAGVAGNIFAESGGDPEILEVGGGGGGGLIQWTPYPPGYITGDYQKDLYTQLNAILSWGGGPSLVNRGKSPSNAAQIYQDYYERPANLTASLPTRMASANAVYSAMGWGKFDQGGWLMPTSTPAGMPGVNLTGQPEAVLTPAESQAFVAIARHLTESGTGGQGLGTTVIQQFNGTQWPNSEQQAAMKREMALTLSGP